MCGGTILDDTTVVTAAHCCDGYQRRPRFFIIFFFWIYLITIHYFVIKFDVLFFNKWTILILILDK